MHIVSIHLENGAHAVVHGTFLS